MNAKSAIYGKKARLLHVQSAQYSAELLVGDGGVCAVANYTERVASPPPLAFIIFTVLRRHDEMTEMI
jgi:hypothetical protein